MNLIGTCNNPIIKVQLCNMMYYPLLDCVGSESSKLMVLYRSSQGKYKNIILLRI